MKKKKLLMPLLLGLSAVALVSCGSKKNDKEETSIVPSDEQELSTLEIKEFKVSFLNYDGTELYSYNAKKG